MSLVVTAQLKLERIAKAIDKARRDIFAVMGFKVRATAQSTIEQAAGPSPAGTPPHTHKRKFLHRSIIYYADWEGALIGSRFSAVGLAGSAHEKGGEFKGGTYPKRPFMVPALEANLDAFADEWRGAVG